MSADTTSIVSLLVCTVGLQIG